MNYTTTLAQEGSNSAHFYVKKPRWSTASSIDKPCQGQLTHLSFETPATEPIVYHVMAVLEFEEPERRMFARTMQNRGRRRVDNTPNDLVTRFRRLFAPAWDHFTEFRALPRLDYSLRERRFYVEIPQYSSLFTTTEQFFRLLGFTEVAGLETLEEKTLQTPDGDLVVRATGFFNDAGTEPLVIFAEEERHPDVRINEFAYDEAFEYLTTFQMEVVERMEGEFIFDEDGILLRNTDLHTAMECLAGLGEAMADQFNLVKNPIRLRPLSGVEEDDQGTEIGAANENLGLKKFRLSNSAFHNSRLCLTLLFDDGTAKAFLIPAGRAFVFPLDDIRSHVLTATAGARVDPFKGLYPVKIIGRSFGASGSWAGDDLGYVHVLGKLRQGGSIDPKKAVFEIDTGGLTLQFLDFASRVITFRRNIHLHLEIEFKEPPPPNTSPQVPISLKLPRHAHHRRV